MTPHMVREPTDEARVSIRSVWTPLTSSDGCPGTMNAMIRDLLEQDDKGTAYRYFRSLNNGAQAEAMEAVCANPKRRGWPLRDAKAVRIKERRANALRTRGRQ